MDKDKERIIPIKVNTVKTMKKVLIFSLASLLAANVCGQDISEPALPMNIDWQEDSTEIVTVDDIVKTQQDITRRNFSEQHYRDVWGRKGYVNIGYNSSKLTADEFIATGKDGRNVPEFSSSWGASLMVGRAYALHKRPIANIAQFNIDYTYIDLNVNHYDIEGDGRNLFDSRERFPKDDQSYYFTPWNLEKYELNYGMALGPSLTVAPFTMLNVRALHYVKLNVYYHIGYHASMLMMLKNDQADVNQEGVEGYEKTDYEKANTLKLDWGHGLISSFGFNVTWKFVGIGYEHRSGSVKYQSVATSDYGSEWYKFKTSTSRVYLQFRM